MRENLRTSLPIDHQLFVKLKYDQSDATENNSYILRICFTPTFGMKSYECGPWRDSWGRIGLLSLPWRGRPEDKVILDPQKWYKPVLADIPYWISASFQVRPWLFLMWAFRLLILALLEPHTGQQNGFSPVCILMCIISFCFEMNFLLHWSHWWSQDSCLRKDIVQVLIIFEVTGKRGFSNLWKRKKHLKTEKAEFD